MLIGYRRREVHGLRIVPIDWTMNISPDITLPGPGHQTVADHGSIPRKSLAQHFLADRRVLRSILSAAEPGPQDTVVEVGPGTGALTRALVSTAKRVVAIELDSRLADSLASRLGNPPNLDVINTDAREFDPAQLLGVESGYMMVGNLPYYAASPILRRFLEAGRHRPSHMVVMVQKEVATRMVAADGRMSLLALGIQLYGIPRIINYVPATAFYPQPKVSSAIVRIDPLARPAIEVENEAFFRVVRAGFAAPRKQLRNSLSQGLGTSPEEAGQFLRQAGMDPKRRPENLSLQEWEGVYHAVVERSGRGD